MYFTVRDWNHRFSNSQVYVLFWIVLSSWYLVHQLHMQGNKLTTHMKRNEKCDVSVWLFSFTLLQLFFLWYRTSDLPLFSSAKKYKFSPATNKHMKATGTPLLDTRRQ